MLEDLALKVARWGLVALIFGIVVWRNRQMLDHVDLLREVGLVVFAYFAYFAVRGMTQGNVDTAMANADRVIELERNLHILWEPRWQQAIIDHRWIVNLTTWLYVWGHWPLIIIVATWLYTSWPETYRLFRNAFIFSGAIGLVIFMIFPVAPPRLADFPVVDTVTLHSHSYRVLQPPALVNQYAAVPSLHFGWNMLIGIVLFTKGKSLITKAFGAVIPFAMFFAIVLTANHYIFDAIAGGTVALIGLYLSARFTTQEAPASQPTAAARQRWG